MKLIGHFADLLRDTVNLNQTRIDDLEASVDAIKTFVKDSDWEPRVWKFVERGSWAHGTIIRPVDGNEFDADLLVIVEPVEGWFAADDHELQGHLPAWEPARSDGANRERREGDVGVPSRLVN
jgi:hypothetical protein